MKMAIATVLFVLSLLLSLLSGVVIGNGYQEYHVVSLLSFISTSCIIFFSIPAVASDIDTDDKYWRAFILKDREKDLEKKMRIRKIESLIDSNIEFIDWEKFSSEVLDVYLIDKYSDKLRWKTILNRLDSFSEEDKIEIGKIAAKVRKRYEERQAK
jgi:hypothetical protein